MKNSATPASSKKGCSETAGGRTQDRIAAFISSSSTVRPLLLLLSCIILLFFALSPVHSFVVAEIRTSKRTRRAAVTAATTMTTASDDNVGSVTGRRGARHLPLTVRTLAAADVLRRSSENEDADDVEEEEEDCPFPTDAAQLRSPALMRGTALTRRHKDWNRGFVHTIKSFVFDNLYGGTTGSSTAAPDDDDSCYYAAHYARFYALETIARMPYFAYLSVLHLLETLGQWRRAEFLKLHFAEAWNELHHLLILEELLGSKITWRDQFVAQHLAVAYYWVAVTVYLVNPAVAYNVNQAVEEEAYDTYDSFLQKHRPYLQSHPAPAVARTYYAGDDLYLFDSMHHPAALDLLPSHNEDQYGPSHRRRPPCETLYDTFVNIRDDEMEHVKTMMYLQGECREEEEKNDQVQPPSHQHRKVGAAAAAAASVPWLTYNIITDNKSNQSTTASEVLS